MDLFLVHLRVSCGLYTYFVTLWKSWLGDEIALHFYVFKWIKNIQSGENIMSLKIENRSLVDVKYFQ